MTNTFDGKTFKQGDSVCIVIPAKFNITPKTWLSVRFVVKEVEKDGRTMYE